MPYIVIQQLRSPIRRPHNQRATLIGLGLNRIGRVSWLEDTPSVRGMIKQVSHLVRVLHDPLRPGSPRSPCDRKMKGMKMPQFLPVSSFLCNAFHVAQSRYKNNHEGWIDLSIRLGGRFSLPPAMMSIQRYGDLDLLIRCIEDEVMNAAAINANTNVNRAFHYQKMLSENWIMGVYEIFRALRQRDEERKVGNDEMSSASSFRSIFSDLELLRMPLAKYEIAKDKKMDQPLPMKPLPENSAAEELYTYDGNDPNRYHIMPSGISPRGSIMWMALDHKSPCEYWVERRELADRILALNEIIISPGILKANQQA